MLVDLFYALVFLFLPLLLLSRLPFPSGSVRHIHYALHLHRKHRRLSPLELHHVIAIVEQELVLKECGVPLQFPLNMRLEQWVCACQVGFEEVHNVVGEGKRVAQEGVIAFDEHAFEPEVHFIHESDSRCLFVHSDLESQQRRLFVVQEQPRLQYGGKHWVYGALVVDLD